jgi:hypothetical protein
MIDIVEEFGLNAGRVWKALNERGILTESQLMEESSLRKNELFAAIGWLARENKINKEGICYKLDTTNLTSKIGTDAGTIWQILVKEGNSDSKNISKMTNLNEQDIYLALGWLAREGKINLRK